MPDHIFDLSNQDDIKQRRRAYLVCLPLFACYFLVFFHRLAPAVLAGDMARDFGAGGALLGLLGAAYFYTYAFMQPGAGFLADFWGPRKTVAAFFTVAAAGSALMALAPTLNLAVIGRAMVGLGVATVFVCNYKLLAEWFEPRRFLVMGGLFQLVGGLGGLCSSAPLAWMSQSMGWRTTVLIVGGISLALAGLVWLLVRDRPDGASDNPGPNQEPDPRDRQTEISAGARFKLVLTTWRFWALAVWTMCASGIGFALAGLWGGPYLIQVHHLTKAQAGGVLATFSLGLIVSGPIIPPLANRFGRKPIMIWGSLLTTALMVLIWLVNKNLPVWSLYILFFLVTWGTMANGPIMASVAKEMFPRSIAGASVGLINGFPFLGGAVFQVVIGWIVAKGDPAAYGDMFLFCAVMALISLIAALPVPETMSKNG